MRGKEQKETIIVLRSLNDLTSIDFTFSAVKKVSGFSVLFALTAISPFFQLKRKCTQYLLQREELRFYLLPGQKKADTPKQYLLVKYILA